MMVLDGQLPAPGRAHGDPVDFARAKTLVIGASGFLGRPLVRRLAELNADVSAMSRDPPGEPDDAHWVAGDASDPAQVARVFEGTHPDIVYILTSDSRGGPDLDLVQPSVQNDVVATTNILVEATRHRCRHVVMTGSLDEPEGMTRIATPSTPYAAAKWVIGGYARMFRRLYGTPISILRPMMTYGPGQKGYKLIPSIIDALLQGRTVELGSGRRLVDWVYIDDVVDAFVRTAAGKPMRATVDLGSGELVSIRECALLIAGLLDRPHLLEFDPARDRPYEEAKAADTLPAARRLGWRATTPLRIGLQKTILAHESQRSETKGGPS
ncbi:MAG: NAD(P)-dependent oxidoreductase [Ramlibacter sp.]|nr:NAD(P)-dependent oxidoreductase [Ramlibacter sp.]